MQKKVWQQLSAQQRDLLRSFEETFHPQSSGICVRLTFALLCNTESIHLWLLQNKEQTERMWGFQLGQLISDGLLFVLLWNTESVHLWLSREEKLFKPQRRQQLDTEDTEPKINQPAGSWGREHAGPQSGFWSAGAPLVHRQMFRPEGSPEGWPAIKPTITLLRCSEKDLRCLSMYVGG